jgi:3-oxoacyl-[acyl-carrier-protein] synthase III
MRPFVVNRHGRLVFPSNFVPELDFSVIETEKQLVDVVRRDYEKKAPTGTDILARIEAGSYPNRYALMNDMALNLFWVNRSLRPCMTKGRRGGKTCPATVMTCSCRS